MPGGSEARLTESVFLSSLAPMLGTFSFSSMELHLFWVPLCLDSRLERLGDSTASAAAHLGPPGPCRLVSVLLLGGVIEGVIRFFRRLGFLLISALYIQQRCKLRMQCEISLPEVTVSSSGKGLIERQLQPLNLNLSIASEALKMALWSYSSPYRDLSWWGSWC